MNYRVASEYGTNKRLKANPLIYKKCFLYYIFVSYYRQSSADIKIKNYKIKTSFVNPVYVIVIFVTPSSFLHTHTPPNTQYICIWAFYLLKINIVKCLFKNIPFTNTRLVISGILRDKTMDIN